MNALGKTVKYISFSILIKKEVIKIDKDGVKSVETISMNMKFIISLIFMGTSLSKLVDNLKEEIHGTKYRNWDCFLEYESVKDYLIIYKCLSCNRDYSSMLNEELKDKFKNTFKFSKIDIKKFTLLLRKGIYPYEHMDDWAKFHETALPEKEKFCSNSNLEDITDPEYMYAKRVCKDFEIKVFEQYHDLKLEVMYYF